MDNIKIGDTVKIIKMEGEPQYTDRVGVVTHIDDAGQIHGTWGGCAIIPNVDTYVICLIPINDTKKPHSIIRICCVAFLLLSYHSCEVIYLQKAS